MEDFEKLGEFYLGRVFDLKEDKLKEDKVLYDSKDLTTHGVCVGMTGSGKTGLAISLLEEAAIDGIPAIVIDPKGDMGNLLLSFPDLLAQDFQPWLDEGEAMKKGLTLKEYATKTASLWKNGLAEWGMGGERIKRFKDSAEILIYTPGSNAGIPVNVLGSFNAPKLQVINDRDAFKEVITGTATSILSLLGIDADPIQSKEHILISKILADSWSKSKNLNIADLIRHIQSPLFQKVGVFDVDTFYPLKERMKLAMTLNNLLASPGFETWMDGTPLDVSNLLYTPEGKPKISIFSISHLSDSERMFFVSLLLNEMVSWMRTQDGTSSLRALLYMDEIYGYFPPTASPPSKTPMLTLLKQARAFGLGVLLSTQNPVDLDYKGLSNTGTWFIGRLQTDRDKQRMLDGLEGVGGTGGDGLSRNDLDNLISSLGKRKFLLHNVHESKPVVFNTRWVLSYLRGPLTSPQIKELMKDKALPEASPMLEKGKVIVKESKSFSEEIITEKPLLPPGIIEKYMLPQKSKPTGASVQYRPRLLGLGKLHFISAKAKLDYWNEMAVLMAFPEEVSEPLWDEAEFYENTEFDLEESMLQDAIFKSLPKSASNVKSYLAWKKSLINYLYQSKKLSLWNSGLLKEISRPGETEAEFKLRLTQLMREKRDLMLEKMRKKYAPKLARLEARMDRSMDKVEKEKAQFSNQKYQTAISIGTTLLGAMFGRKVASSGNIGKAATSMRGVGRAAQEKKDVDMAKLEVEEVQKLLSEMELDSKMELDKIREQFSPESIELEEMLVSPRKSDISFGKLKLVWIPFWIDNDGIAESAV